MMDPPNTPAKIREKVEEKLRPLTLPNFITLIRMAIVPFLVLAVYEKNFKLALWILIIAGVTDSFDGWLARKMGAQSVVGAYLDPVADKLLLTAVYLSLAIPHGQAVVIPMWLAILAMGRDLLIMLVALILYVVEGVRRFPPSILGKLTNAAHVCTVAAVLLANLWAVPESLLRVVFYVSFALVILSGFNYLYRANGLIEAAREERNGDGG